jgi:hypothetical protein
LKERKRVWQHPAVVKLIRASEGKKDPVEIIREKTRALVRMFYGRLIKGPPFNPEILASLMGAKVEYKKPILGEEAQLIPLGDKLLIRCNPYSSRVRQNFSLFHELSHILLMDFRITASCTRTVSEEFEVEDEIEYLCDISAAELLLPLPWFTKDMEKQGVNIDSILTLGRKYAASREAVAIRMVQLSSFPCAAVFFSWKNKPQDRKAPGKKGKEYLFPELRPLPPRKLRVDFSVSSPTFSYFIPRFKSIEEKTLVYQSSLDGRPRRGIDWLNLGRGRIPFYVEALPLIYRGGKPPYRVIALLSESIGVRS